ncbi:MAG: pilus assembly PilX family protein [Burkholderiales bacterium]
MKKKMQIRDAGKFQRGSVLIFSLVFLVLLTIIVVAALNSNTAQTTMSGSTQTQIQALGAAESELPKLETALNSAVLAGGTVCTCPAGPQNIPYTASIAGGYTAPSGVSYTISCANRKTVQQTVWDTVTNTYVITPSGSCLDYYRIELTDTSGKGTQRVVESQYAVAPVACGC